MFSVNVEIIFRLLVELADTPDSKPGAVKSVTVRLRGGRPSLAE
jgi:hypothetical protein